MLARRRTKLKESSALVDSRVDDAQAERANREPFVLIVKQSGTRSTSPRGSKRGL